MFLFNGRPVKVSQILSDHLLSSCQYGFRPRSSTQEALLSITNDWHLMLSKNCQVASIFFDVEKAFDSVPHDKMILSLARTGISGPLLQWFLDYLTSRQWVALDGESFSLVAAPSGVSQGSILGPLLIIILWTQSLIYLFPWVPKLFYTPMTFCCINRSNLPQDVLLLQHDVNLILHWIRDKGLTPNHSKTMLLQVTRSKNVSTNNISIDGHPLSCSESVKYLGVTLSSNLTWSKHINTICKQLNATLDSFIASYIKLLHKLVTRSTAVLSSPNWTIAVLCGIHTTLKTLLPWTEFNGLLAGSSHTNGSPTTPPYWTP